MENNNLIYIIAPFAGWISAQLIKVTIFKKKSLGWGDALQSGGMPSSHASYMFALCFSIGFGEGFSSLAFAITLAIALIISYDATDVRLATGQQTQAINKIASKQDVKINKIHQARGHTITEVIAGIITGVAVAVVLNIIV
jgi:acid phosphatase family membrane protein YuiD